LPVLWVCGGLVALFASEPARPVLVGDPTVLDTYYVVPQRHFALGLPAAFALFALAYVALAVWFPRFRRIFGLIHFGLMAIGAYLTYAPPLFLILGGWPRRFEDPQQAFAFWRTIQMVGEGLMLAGLGTFAAAVLSGFRRGHGPTTP
jgi:cytochrome c oxidase subunit 1